MTAQIISSSLLLTAVVSLISNNDESVHREELNQLAEWCRDNNPLLNVDDTKEIIVDYLENPSGPLTIAHQ